MSNLFRDFANLFPDPALQVATVTATSGDLATVTLPGGGVLQVRGAATVGQKVFIRNGVIEAEAPSLPLVTLEI